MLPLALATVWYSLVPSLKSEVLLPLKSVSNNEEEWDEGEEEEWLEELGKLAIVSGAAILGGLLLKALFDKNTYVHRCPTCNLVIRKGIHRCPRCGTFLNWRGVP